jgi:hypothetical protein
MTTSSDAKKKGQKQIPDSFEFGIAEAVDTESAGTEYAGNRPKKFGGYIGAANCTHEWFELDPQLQTLSFEGKTIWRCRNCAEITNTYSWRKP